MKPKNILILILTIVACVVVLFAIGGTKYLQILGLMKQYANFTIPPESVTTAKAEGQSWIPELKAIGSTDAVQGVVVSTDLSGIVTKINFESGQKVKQGDLLVQLDVNEEQAQLRSAEAQQKLAGLNLQRQQNLLKSRVSSQADFDAAQAQYDQTTAAVEQVKAAISKKTILAPFTGVLGIRMVNLGQYLESGAKIAPLQSLDPIYVNFWAPQQNLPRLSAGQDVKVTVDGSDDLKFEGKINAIDSVVDEATRNVRVQATLPNPDGKLRAGMFVNVSVPLAEKNDVVVVPATAVQYAPYGDSVFIVEQIKDDKGKEYLGVRQQVVKVGDTKGDQVAVSGVKDGEEVVTSGGFKLRAGSAVEVNNSVQPSNEAAPKPEDT